MTPAALIGLIIRLLLLLTPFFVLSVFLTISSELTRGGQRLLALRITSAVLIICLVLYFFGNVIFRYLGISLDAFRVGAGLVLLLNGIDMVRSTGTPANRLCGSDNDIAVVPLAIPYTVGPGTIGALLVMGAEPGLSYSERFITAGAIVLAVGALGLVLFFGEHLGNVLKKKGVNILSKLTGMYLIALAAQIIFTGVKNFLT